MNIKRFRKSVLRKALSLTLCVGLLVPAFTSAFQVSATTIAEAEAQKEELAQEKENLDNKLSQLKEDENSATEYQATLEEKIDIVRSDIDKAITDIEELDTSIKKLEEKITKSNEEMETTLDLFYEKVKVLYKKGSFTGTNPLEILMNSASLHEYAVATETMRSVSKRDEQIMEKLEVYMEETKDEREECKVKKDELAQRKKDLDNNKAELDELQTENERVLSEIKDTKAATENALLENEAQSAELIDWLASEIEKKRQEDLAAQEAANNANNNEGSYDEEGNYTPPADNGGGGGGGMFDGDFNPIWPIPGVYYITGHYGNGHNGLDIAGPYGTPIVAAESGQVIVANNYDSWGDSWGYYVLIYHNSTYTTRYAHLSSLAVSNGQYVSKGQVVGYEGSTGNSTGPHLHFEIYQNGYRINPYPWVA